LTATATPSHLFTQSNSGTQGPSTSLSQTESSTLSATGSGSPTQTQSQAVTSSLTATGTRSQSATLSASPSQTRSGSQTQSWTPSRTASLTGSPSFSPSPSGFTAQSVIDNAQAAMQVFSLQTFRWAPRPGRPCRSSSLRPIPRVDLGGIAFFPSAYLFARRTTRWGVTTVFVELYSADAVTGAPLNSIIGTFVVTSIPANPGPFLRLQLPSTWTVNALTQTRIAVVLYASIPSSGYSRMTVSRVTHPWLVLAHLSHRYRQALQA